MIPKFHLKCILVILFILIIVYFYPDHKDSKVADDPPSQNYIVVGFIPASATIKDKFFYRSIYIIKLNDTYFSITKENKPKDIISANYLKKLTEINKNKLLKIGDAILLPSEYDLEFLRHPKAEIKLNDGKLLENLKLAEGTIAYQSKVKVSTINGYKTSFKNNKFYPYKDKYGNWTIGYGRLIDYKQAIKYKNGISITQANKFLIEDLSCAKKHLKYFMEYNKITYLPQEWRNVLTELIFNTGLGGVMTFKDLISNLQNQNYSLAKDSLFDSKWAEQIAGQRLERIKNELEQF